MKTQGISFLFLLAYVRCFPYQKSPDVCEEFLQRSDCYYFACIDSIYRCGPQNLLVQFAYHFCDALLERNYFSLTSFGQIWANTSQQCLMHEIDVFLRRTNSSLTCAGIDRYVLSKYPACLTRSHANVSLCSIMCNNLEIFLKIFHQWNLNGINLKRLLIETSEFCPEESQLKTMINLKDSDIPMILWSLCLDSLKGNFRDFQADELMIQTKEISGTFAEFFIE